MNGSAALQGRIAALLTILATTACTSALRTEPLAQSHTRRTSVARPAAEAGQVVESVSSFDTTVKPIFEKHCRPCHFTGGVMYDKLPFDRAETIRQLAEGLFTRIKDPDEQAAIRTFLAQQP
jgi:cytochrome c5